MLLVGTLFQNKIFMNFSIKFLEFGYRKHRNSRICNAKIKTKEK